MRASRYSGRKNSGGFTLIELMIGTAIALVLLLVMGTVFENASRNRGTTTSGADAQTSGAIASHMVERDLRMAGYGFNLSDLLGCEIYAYDEQSSPSRSFTWAATPVTITAGNSTPTTPYPFGTPDSLTISYSTSDVGFGLAKLSNSNNGANANFQVGNRFGFHEGDLIVVVEPVDRYTPDPTSKEPSLGANGLFDCVLAQVTGVPGTPGQSDNIIHNSGNYTNSQGRNVPARYNKAGGLGISFTTNAKIFNLGPTPASITYTVNTKAELTRLDSVDSETAEALSENIVMIRAHYGKDTDDNGSVDTWNQTMPTSPALWSQVIAVQYAVVARSKKKEPIAVTATPLTLWTNGPTLALTNEQRQYRYKVFHALVPLKNMIWSSS